MNYLCLITGIDLSLPLESSFRTASTMATGRALNGHPKFCGEVLFKKQSQTKSFSKKTGKARMRGI